THFLALAAVGHGASHGHGSEIELERYTAAGSSEDVLHWRPKRLPDGRREEYSVGDGYCLMRTSNQQRLEQMGLVDEEELRRLAKGPPVWLVSSNCRVRSLGPVNPQLWRDRQNRTPSMHGWPVKVQLFHCPKRVPVAFLTVPKCGTTSTINWVLQMEGQEQLRSLERSGKAFLHHQGPGQLADLVKGELESAASQGTIPNEKLMDKDFASLVMFRALHRYKPGLESYDATVTVEREFLPPANLCPLCCIHGWQRQRVVLARNPFVRLMSYFRFVWLNNPNWGDHKWTGWAGFSDYYQFVLQMRDSKPGLFANGLDWVPESVNKCKQENDGKLEGTALHPWICKTTYYTLSAYDIFHLRPVSDMVSDERFLAGPAAMEDILVLHLETLKEDILQLEEALCSRFGFCEKLPPFPSVLPGKNIRDSAVEGAVKEKCGFKEKTLTWHNCTAPEWLQLWDPRVTSMVVRHYRQDFRWLGYSTDPANLLPL
ncbi:unnamed protein product, partial [Cladocopium goreaui]